MPWPAAGLFSTFANLRLQMRQASMQREPRLGGGVEDVRLVAVYDLQAIRNAIIGCLCRKLLQAQTALVEDTGPYSRPVAYG